MDGATAGLVVLAALVLFAIVVVAKSVALIPQAEAAVIEPVIEPVIGPIIGPGYSLRRTRTSSYGGRKLAPSAKRQFTIVPLPFFSASWPT